MPDILERIAWGRPDSLRRPFCALCSGYVGFGDDPDDFENVAMVELYKPDGSAARFCRTCGDDVIRAILERKRQK